MPLHEGWIKRFVQRFANQRKPLRRQSRWASTGLENLECRALLSFNPAAASPFDTGGSEPKSVAAADVNGDGHLDLITANLSSNDISILLGDGAGGFTAAPSSPITDVGTGAIAVAVSDLNGDGKPDLAIANYQSNDVAVLLGDGMGGFTPAAGMPIDTGGTQPHSIVVADVNGDGNPDLVTANLSSNNVSVLLGDGAGNFTAAAGSPFAIGGRSPTALVVADLNNDGKLDVATANQNSNDVSVLLGNGAGGFAPAANSPFATGGQTPVSIAVGDVSGDGAPDLVTANYSSDNVSVLLGNNAGGFTAAPESPFATGGAHPYSVAVVHTSGDGSPELVTANFATNNVSVLLGDGTGGFAVTPGSVIATGGTGPISVVAADVNGDGSTDLVTANLLSDNVSVMLSGPFAYLAGSTLMLDFDGSASPIALATSGTFVTATRDTTTYEFPMASVSDILGNGIASGDTLDCNANIARPLAFSGGLGNGTVNINSGTYSFNSDVGATTNLSVMINSGGNAVFNASQHLAALHITGTGSAVLLANGSRVLCTPDLSVASTARLDLKDNALVVEGSNPNILGTWNGSAYTGITGLIASGRDNGTWSGDGIVTSMSDAGPSMLTTLSVATATQVLGIGSSQTEIWRGETVTGADTLVKYTYSGDATLSGYVNADDYFQIDAHYGKSADNAKSFYNGDFNYDGQINGDDYFIIDSGFLGQPPRPSAPTALRVTSVSDTAISFDWDHVDTNETSITVWRSIGGGAYARLTSLPAGTNTFTDNTCTANTTYRYALSADNAMASSPLSASVQQMTLPSAPINVAATAVSDTEINLTWDRVGTGENSITIWRSTGDGAYAKLVTLPAGSNIFTDTSCYPRTTYRYAVSQDFATTSSPLSAFAETTTLSSQATVAAATAVTASSASPFAVTLTWNDSISPTHSWFIERSTDNVSYTVVTGAAGASGSVSVTDSFLTPATTFYYRLRANTNGGSYSDYSAPVSVTTQTRVANTPQEATALTATVNSATSTTLNWNDTNGGAASYVIETAQFSWPNTPAWTQVAVTAAGATSYQFTTTAESFYYVRVRARNAAGDSNSTPQVVIRTPSAGTGSPKTYKIGPGQTYTTLAALDWTKLGPGDTVQIYPNKDSNGNIIPYYEKPLISVRGTAAAPITITGMADPTTGQLPIIDGTNAVTASQWTVGYLPLEDLSLVLIGTRPTQISGGWSPGYFTLSNLEVRNGYGGDPGTTNNYTAADGTTRSYGTDASGIYIEKGDHITIKSCIIDANGNGVFGAGQGDQRNLEQITLDSNHIYGNGRVNDYLEHNTYLEGIDTVYQFNTYGPLRSGATGGGLKDRGAGTIIRYNSIQGGGHLIDLVETQNYGDTELLLASYHQTYVYGNILLNDANAVNGASVTPIHYGGDQGNRMVERKGILHFYDNTFVNRADQPQAWKVGIFSTSSPSEAIDARNNIIVSIPTTTGNAVPELDLLPSNGIGYLGVNWLSPGWQPSFSGYGGFGGYLAGTANILTNSSNDPGFVNFAANDFHLAAGSQAIDKASDLSADEPPVLFEYSPTGQVERTLTGTAIDLGAYERG